jgi:hypothetical protein
MKRLPLSHKPHKVKYIGGAHEEIAPGGVRELWGIQFEGGKSVIISDPALVKKIQALVDDFEIEPFEGEVKVEEVKQPAKPLPTPAKAPKKRSAGAEMLEKAIKAGS